MESLTYIYILCIQQNCFPPTLKAAKVILLPETKDLSDPSNFRPISLLSILSKPLERHIHKHLTHFIKDHNLFLKIVKIHFNLASADGIFATQP